MLLATDKNGSKHLDSEPPQISVCFAKALTAAAAIALPPRRPESVIKRHGSHALIYEQFF